MATALWRGISTSTPPPRSVIGTMPITPNTSTTSSSARCRLGCERSSHVDADERQYVDDVSRMWQLPVATVSATGIDPWRLDDDVRRNVDLPDAPTAPIWGSLLERARSDGSRVVLWGHGGDEWLTGDASHCADLLASFELRSAFRQLRSDMT